MRENRVKRILNDGGLAIGTHVGGIADPQIVEIIGLAGFDAAFIDMEHTSFDLRDIQLMVMAAERAGITPVVRTPGFDPAFILRLLDMGVQGVQVPHVSSADTAREAVKAVRYPPQGERGMAAASRAADYGKTRLLDHMAASNKEITLACMIEDMEAVENIDAIAAVEGVDLLAVGPSDLSRSLGVSGQPDHPRLVAAIDRVREAVRKSNTGVRLALPLAHAAFPRDAAQLKALGAGYTNCAPTPEVRLLKSMQDQAAEARKLLGQSMAPSRFIASPGA
jgi:4-hydroxy-2-oxoheptanedioate aldolase